MKKKTRDYRAEEIFQRWLRDRRYRRFKETFDEFRNRCDDGDVPGLGPEDFVGPVSDTATGGSETPELEKRDVASEDESPKPGTAAEQLGPSDEPPEVDHGTTLADVFGPGREMPF